MGMEKPKPAQRNFVNEALERHRSWEANYETEEDALLAALESLVEDARAGDLEAHARGMRGESQAHERAESPEFERGEEEGEKEALAPECEAGECEHPEHQLESNLPDDDHDFGD